jgi:hypothetical protein
MAHAFGVGFQFMIEFLSRCHKNSHTGSHYKGDGNGHFVKNHH